MSLKRVVYVLTANTKKLPQFTRSFDRFGITVIQAPPTSNVSTLLRSGDPASVTKGDRTKVVAVLREETCMRDYYTGKEVTKLVDLQRVNDASLLTVHMIDEKDKEVTKTYSESTEGHIDLRGRGPKPEASGTEDVFGWDDAFYAKYSMGRSLHDLLKLGFKYTSRDIVISQFIRDHIYYKTTTDLKWNPQKQSRSVDFAQNVQEFCERNKYLNTEFANKYGIANVYKAVLNNGVFFRSAKNRREKTYWLPGLNAGLPFTPKRDEIHEITYMFHDFGHFLVPDLVFTGNTSSLHRKVYIAYRMISEAVTMTLADMVFIDSINASGISYDFTTRKIFPLVDDLGIRLRDDAASQRLSPSFAANVRRLMQANVAYAVRGDDSVYRRILKQRGKDETNLELFKGKYMPFFVEDLRWTAKNEQNFSSRPSEYKRWWNNVAPLRTVGNLELKTIDDYITAIGCDITRPEEEDERLMREAAQGQPDLIERVFAQVFATCIKPILTSDVQLLPQNIRLQRAFYKYMMGQMAIFSRYDFESSSAIYQRKIYDFLVRHRDDMTLEKINACRSFYEQYVDRLQDQRLMTVDDALTYKEIFPLFEPFYVFYDADLSSYQSLSSLSNSIFQRRPTTTATAAAVAPKSS